jgi:hypothetical protein
VICDLEARFSDLNRKSPIANHKFDHPITAITAIPLPLFPFDSHANLLAVDNIVTTPSGQQPSMASMAKGIA